MTYLFLYVVGIVLIWWIYRVGWIEALKTVIKVLVPSILIILFNIKAGRLLFKNPLVGLLSALPTSIFIYRGSLPVVASINNWIDTKRSKYEDSKEVIDWSIRMSEHNTRWDGHLICAEALNVDNIPISPSHGTSLFDVLVVHKELFLGFD